MKTTVIFVLWGQRCETVFDSTSELDPETWIKTCQGKGFIYPVEVVLDNGIVVYSEDQLQEMVAEL